MNTSIIIWHLYIYKLLAVYKIESNSAPELLNLLNLLQKRDKMLSKQ